MSKERVRIINKSTKPMCFPVGRFGVMIPTGDGSMAGGGLDNKNLVTLDKWAAIRKLKSAQKFIEAGLLVGPDVPEDVTPAPTTAEIKDADKAALEAKQTGQVEALKAGKKAAKGRGRGKGKKAPAEEPLPEDLADFENALTE